MKTLKLKRLLSLAFAGLVTVLHVPIVFAAAGDTISNTATLTFDVGGTGTVLESSPTGNTVTGGGNGTATDFTEDRVINFTVAEVGAATTQVSPSATLQVQTFTVTNNGNGPQDFLLAAIDAATTTADPHGGNADSFDVTSSQVFVETVNAGFNAADDTDIFIDELAAGASRTVYIVSTIPAATLPLANGDVAVMSLVAQVAVGGTASPDDSVAANAGAAITNDDNGNTSPAGTYNNGATAVAAGVANDVADIATGVGSEQIVFNDPAGATAADVDSAGVQDVIQNGQHSDSDSYTVGAAELTVTKTSSVLWSSPTGNSNPKAIPGAYVQYTITIANAGTAGASGDLTTLADSFAASGLDLDPDLIDGTAAAFALPGAPESAAGDAIRIDTTGTARPSAGTTYCTGDVGDADTDGCSYTGGAGGSLSVVFADPVPANPNIAGMAAEAGYTEGELKPGESVVIVFNVIVP